jgi:hypothetical protein
MVLDGCTIPEMGNDLIAAPQFVKRIRVEPSDRERVRCRGETVKCALTLAEHRLDAGHIDAGQVVRERWIIAGAVLPV